MAIKFVFLVLPHVHILDLAGPDQAIHEAIDFKADFEMEYCGIGEAVATTSGLPIGELKHFSQVEYKAGDFLIIPGCDFGYLTSAPFLGNRELFRWINKLYEEGVAMCSICMGAFVLAESGLLNGKSCTTHFKKTEELQRRYPKIKVVENILFTDQDNLFTSAGLASGIDLMLHIIEQLRDGHFTHFVARELVVFIRRSGNDSQESEFLKYRNHIHAGIHKAQEFIMEHIAEKTSLPELAEVANMSERSFTRIFKKETGVTVNEYLNMVRLAKAGEFLKNPNLSKIEVAKKVGLRSEKQLYRIIQQHSK
jgi:transcriptional regulator GlxA family with amidase domain